jgi:sugar phosphate isomerase/epimerase
MIGISTACFYPMLTEETIAPISKMGFSQIEIFLNALCECDADYCRDLKKRLDDAGLRVWAVHSPLSAYEYLLLFSNYPRRVKDGLALYRRVMEAAAMLGAKWVTFHGDRFENPAYRGIEGYCEVIGRLLELSAKSGVGLSQENVSWCRSSSPEFLAELAARVDDPYFGFTFDLKQAVRANVPFETYLGIMGKKIVNVHLSDHLPKDSCLLPGEGEMDYPSFFDRFKQLGYGGPFIIEVYSSDFNSVAQIDKARKNLMLNFC